jgi:hypothetical protein
MTITLTYTDEERDEAKAALVALNMRQAALDFDNYLRGILKYGWKGLEPTTVLDAVELIRDAHRACWAEEGVIFDGDGVA